MKKIKINHLDLFSGIGGFHLGFEKAGFEVNSYFSEVDKYAIDVYKNNFKNSNYVGSVTNVRGKQLPKIDAITFGSQICDRLFRLRLVHQAFNTAENTPDIVAQCFNVDIFKFRNHFCF